MRLSTIVEGRNLSGIAFQIPRLLFVKPPYRATRPKGGKKKNTDFPASRSALVRPASDQKDRDGVESVVSEHDGLRRPSRPEPQ